RYRHWRISGGRNEFAWPPKRLALAWIPAAPPVDPPPKGAQAFTTLSNVQASGFAHSARADRMFPSSASSGVASPRERGRRERAAGRDASIDQRLGDVDAAHRAGPFQVGDGAGEPQ